MLLAVAQSWSLHVVHEAYLCKSFFRNAIYQHFELHKKGASYKRVQLEEEDQDQDQDQDDEEQSSINQQPKRSHVGS